jgi:hypothetical protein
MVGRVLKGSTIVALLAGFAGGSVADAQNVSKTVAAGGVLKLSHYASVNPDCSNLSMPIVRVSAAPTHGFVRTIKKSDFSHFAAAPYDRCNSRRVAGVSAEYRPERGFTGTDTLSLDIIYASGRERVESFAITVK